MEDRTCDTAPTGGSGSGLTTTAVTARWRKSSYSNHESACVEVSKTSRETIGFRDSKDPDGPVLSFPIHEAASFITAAGHGDVATRR